MPTIPLMPHFHPVRSDAIALLQATVEQYADPVSGAQHIHLHTDAPELVFLVAFPTVPQASDGRAHILEHLALSGSQRYPVRAPFFSMMRRSTATFMNAFTYADRTVYPFASTSRQDFFNLLDVYLDATFFPRLDYLNFLQEGWRYELDGDRLRYQGVVLNEMKGAFNNPLRALHHGITSQLLAGTTYAMESGGDPLHIPELSHDMLRAFHASHYHPSQAIFMSTGNIPAADIQQQIVSQVLARFSYSGGGQGPTTRRLPELAPVWSAPRSAQVNIPAQQAREDQFGVQTAWLLGESADASAYYQAHLLTAGLLGDASAPLRKAMESAGFGRPSAMNGHDDNARQLVFHIGMEGLTADQVEPAQRLIHAALAQAANAGASVATLKAALRDLSYQQREIRSASAPYGLTRLLEALPVAMVGGDVLGRLDNQAMLEKLTRQVEDPAYFKGIVRGLLDNLTRLDVRVIPDPDYFRSREASEQTTLATRAATLTTAERARITDDMAQLAAHQAIASDTSLLPRIAPADVSPLPQPLPDLTPAEHGVHAFSLATNGISYASVRFDVSHLAADDWPWLRLFTRLAPQLGMGERGYEAAGAWRQAMVPSFDIGLEAQQHLDDRDGAARIELGFSASGLREDQGAIADVLHAAIQSPRFDEHERLAFLIGQLAQSTANQAAESGDRYAMLAASAPLSPQRRFSASVDGAPALAFYRALHEQSATAAGRAAIAACLAQVHRQAVAYSPAVLCAGIEDDGAALGRLLRFPQTTAAAGATWNAYSTDRAPASVALHVASPINHCVIAWPAPPENHADAGALAVAAALLTNQVLHQSLRERGGAYGGYAAYQGGAGVFVMASYRDPRLAATYADFAAAITAVQERAFTDEQIEEAIICVIKELDKPPTPYAQVLATWNAPRRGLTASIRQQYRHQVLDCRQEQVRQAVRRWLADGIGSRAALVGDVEQDLAGLTVIDLLGAPTA